MNCINEKDQKAINMIRALTADSVQKAGNGHPGSAISLAGIMYVLYQKHLKFDPKDPKWIARDRFILSAGHASLAQYCQLFLAGIDLEVEDFKQLRQWESKTPAHPELGVTKGVEMTTGPLGQGFATGVGFAYGSRFEQGLFDDEKNENSPFRHKTYVVVGDGCLQEGVVSEAAILAGVQKLNDLIVIWDSNEITIEGETKIAMESPDNTVKRFESYGFNVQTIDFIKGGNYYEDLDALNSAIINAKNNKTSPSLIRVNTKIAWPTPNLTDSPKTHGNALGEQAIKDLKSVLDIPQEQTFYIDNDILEYTRSNKQKQADEYKKEWNNLFVKWKNENVDKSELFENYLSYQQNPKNIDISLTPFQTDKPISTRAASGKVINEIAKQFPFFWGGSADLAGSNNTTIDNSQSFGPQEHTTKQWENSLSGKVLHFGIREHAMAAIINGIVLSTNTRAFCGTFFPFSDYMRPAVRLAAIMNSPSIFIWSHDSIAVGEDGPTHQSIEHLTAMRAIPNFFVIRPADANETAVCWKKIIQTKTPIGLVLSRQDLPVIGEKFVMDADKGGYVLSDCDGKPAFIAIATGSEVSLALGVQKKLQEDGIYFRVVSMPCVQWFEQQSDEYKKSVLLPNTRIVSLEAGISMCWDKYIGFDGLHIGISHFGASAPASVLAQKFGLNVTDVAQKIKNWI